MRGVSTSLLLLLLIAGLKCQDENTEDVFDMPMVSREINEGMETFETSTEMVDLNDTSLDVSPSQNVFSPITPLDSASGMFNFSKADLGIDEIINEDDDEEEEDDSGDLPDDTTQSSTTIDTITFKSIPIVVDEEVADRRVLKEKETTINISSSSSSTTQTTSQPIDLSSDASEIADNETPFDQSALEGLFEQDGSVIDSSLTTDPPFPILKMNEEETKIIGTPITTTADSMVSTEAETTTETTTTTTTMPSTTTMTTTTQKMEETTEMEMTTSSTSMLNSSKVFLPAKAIRTPISFRITSLQYIDEFADMHSGPAKKLAKTIAPAISEFVSSISSPENMVNVEMVSFSKGSVIVMLDVLTRKSLGDPQMAANLLEAAVSRNNSMLAEYEVDSLSLTVDGVSSQAYIDSISTQNVSSNSSLSSLVIIIIALSIIIIISTALLIIYMTTRKRRNSTMKMSIDDTMRSITPESTESQRSVHLMSYGKAQRASQKPSSLSKSQIDETNAVMY